MFALTELTTLLIVSEVLKLTNFAVIILGKAFLES